MKHNFNSQNELPQGKWNDLTERSHLSDESGTSCAMPTATVLSDSEMDYNDTQDFSDCLRGRVDMKYPSTINNGDTAIWDLGQYEFIPDITTPEKYDPDKTEATVHNSLWRQAQLNKIHGLFEVCDGIYQFRGYDMANITFVEDTDGVIVIDCSTAKETAEKALELFRTHRGQQKVKAVILTHSHTDHYGGINGIIGENGNIPIYAPENFVTEAALENVLVGNAMSRRSTFMYGTFLKASTDGHVDSGLGKAITKGGSTGFLAPTITVVPNTHQASNDVVYECTPITFGGGSLEIEFMLCPHTEAPAEMTVYIHGKNVLVGAEILNHTLHNMLTPRGAEVRDARLWWKAIDKLIARYPQVEIICATHHWPIWNSDDIGYPYPGNPCKKFLRQQRDTYKFLHDQTVRLINKGYTMLELAAYFDNSANLPSFMKNQWHNRGYYGTISHDVRAIYQKYLGWYDMNPANLNPLPPAEAAEQYVAAMGGETAVKKLMQSAANMGNLRWAAELGKHLVYANPSETNRDALADIFTSLGYECEAGTWRDMYLTGAAELRYGGPLNPGGSGTANPAILNAIDVDLFYDFVASRLNGQEAIKEDVAFHITMDNAAMCVEVENGVLNFHPSEVKDSPAFSVVRADFTSFLLGKIGSDELWEKLFDKNSSDRADVIAFFDLFDQTVSAFNIVMPKGGIYQIASRHSQKHVDMQGASTDDNVGAIIWNPHNKDNQKFWFIQQPQDDAYRIMALHSGKYLEPSGTQQSAQLVQKPMSDSDAQLWKVKHCDSEWVKIINCQTGFCMDVQGSSTENSTRVIQYKSRADKDENQQFKLRPVPGAVTVGKTEEETI